MDKKIELINHLLRENIISCPTSKVYYIRKCSVPGKSYKLTMVVESHNPDNMDWGRTLLRILDINNPLLYSVFKMELKDNTELIPSWVMETL